MFPMGNPMDLISYPTITSVVKDKSIAMNGWVLGVDYVLFLSNALRYEKASMDLVCF